jgi:hypothetical protein
LRQVDEAVHLHVKYFQSQLSDHDRMDSLMIFAFYVGLESDSVVADAIRDELDPRPEATPARGPEPPEETSDR